MMIDYQIIKSSQLQSVVPKIMELRAKEFANPPYSYAFDQNAEEEYLREYVKNGMSVCISASSRGEIVGIITGMPLNSDAVIIENAKKNFQSLNRNSEDYFYICEVIVIPQYRNQNIGKSLLTSIENYALSLDKKGIALLSINEQSNNIAKNSRCLWTQAGYKKLDLYEKHHWPTYMPNGEIKDVSHDLVYWEKLLQ